MTTIRDLLLVQAGSEVASDTWGALPKTPTVKLMGIQSFNIEPNVETIVFDEIRGSLQPGFEDAVQKINGSASMGGLLTYQDVPYLLDALFGTETATENTGDTDYFDYIYTAPGASYSSDHPTPRIFTLLEGDANTASDAYSLQGATLNSLGISGASGGPVTFSSEWIGRSVAEDSAAALSDRDVDVVMGNHIAIYIDAIGGTAGSTEIANTGFSFDLNVNANRALKHHFGSLYPTNYRDAKWQGSLALSLELTATTRAYFTSLLGTSPTEKVIRIKATSGTYVWQFDFAGVVTGSPTIHTDNDGVVTIDVTFNGLYNSTQGSWLDMLVTNQTYPLA